MVRFGAGVTTVTVNSALVIRATATPRQVRGLTGASNVSVGVNHSCAKLTNGTAKCWGYGYFHNVRNTSQRSFRFTTPQTVSGVSGVVSSSRMVMVTVIAEAMALLAALVMAAMVKWAMAEPAVTTMATAPSQGPTNSAELGGGYYHMCSRDTDGAVKCWGYNGYGQIGDGTTSSRNTATLVSTMTARNPVAKWRGLPQLCVTYGRYSRLLGS